MRLFSNQCSKPINICARISISAAFSAGRGSQFTSKAWTDVIDDAGVRTSMNDKRRCLDNVFIERLWRSVKYEDIYLRAYENGRELQAGLTALTRLLA